MSLAGWQILQEQSVGRRQEQLGTLDWVRRTGHHVQEWQRRQWQPNRGSRQRGPGAPSDNEKPRRAVAATPYQATPDNKEEGRNKGTAIWTRNRFHMAGKTSTAQTKNRTHRLNLRRKKNRSANKESSRGGGRGKCRARRRAKTRRRMVARRRQGVGTRPSATTTPRTSATAGEANTRRVKRRGRAGARRGDQTSVQPPDLARQQSTYATQNQRNQALERNKMDCGGRRANPRRRRRGQRPATGTAPLTLDSSGDHPDRGKRKKRGKRDPTCAKPWSERGRTQRPTRAL
ncbi:hypothetical protein BS78_01G510700 [Paspalum vaginatum]|nr:hypothetical protein BS78_01G510700 [Paspalum vaginatum]